MDYSAQYHPQPPQVPQSAADSAQIQPYDPSSTYASTQYQYQDPSQIQAYDQSAHSQYQYQYQYQQHRQSQSTADPSQTQPYDPSYYAYNQDYNQQHYSYYASEDYYSNAAAYQQQQQQPERTSIYPPGVPIPPSTSDSYAPQQQHQQQPQYSYYPPQHQQQGINYAEAATVTVPHTPAIVQSPYRGRGKRGGRPYRGGGHGHLGWQPQPIQGGPSQVKPSSAASGNSSTVQPPPRMVWCEICVVGCNTPEVLEVHKSGKKHKKNLKAYEERQKLNKLMDGAHGVQTSNSEFKPTVYNQPEIEGYGQLPKEHLPSDIVTGGGKQLQPLENVPSHAGIEKDGGITGKQKVEETAPVEELAKGQGRGLKRMLRGGRCGKTMKSGNGSRNPAVPSKPKKMVPLICELCNVTCESVVVFQSHLAGKKHLSNLKDFQDQQARVGQAALQALYPALQALYPALQALSQPNTGASTSVAPQSNQPNLHEILGLLTQQALSTISQYQLLGIGTAATSAPSDLEAQDQDVSKFQVSVSEERRGNAAAVDGRNCDLPVLQNTGYRPEENEEPLRFVTRGDVPSTSGSVIAAVSVSNSEVAPSGSAAHSRLDGESRKLEPLNLQ